MNPDFNSLMLGKELRANAEWLRAIADNNPLCDDWLKEIYVRNNPYGFKPLYNRRGLSSFITDNT